ncbi:GLT18 acetylgalactosaminyltransferase, partial [Alcedo cyanopectus]|nr:GLT18 acetylgalactosaminyltransferase [Ceyx cyanopectus]
LLTTDSFPSAEELKEKLRKYVDEVNARKPGFIKVVRHSKQEGLIRSRVSGWRAATAPVVALFDAHVEFNVGWAEPVLTRIKENRKRVISPSFDNIKYDNFEIEEYPLSAQGFDWELWCRYLNPPKSWWKLENTTAPIRSPALIGCFIVDREYFQEIGLLDEGMEVYGGENVELGIRVWQCGGSVEVLPCSRIAHIERAHKPYTEDLTAHVRRNALRVAEVWMDEFKSHVYMAWNIPQEDSGIDIGDISERKALRKKLQCKTFRWYLVSVYPEMRMYSDTVAYGVLQNSLKSDLCLDQGPDTENIPIMYICHGMTPQNVYYTSNQQLHVGVLSPTIDDDDNRCLVDVNSRPRLIECNYAKAKRMKLYWQFTQVILTQQTFQKVIKLWFQNTSSLFTNRTSPSPAFFHRPGSCVWFQCQLFHDLMKLGGPIQNRKSKRCLELQENNDNEFGFQLVLQKCSGQRWSITNVLKSLSS